ncbi:MAG: hypothetical protein JNL68_12240, partial [Burkholderiales bacterium]|nr:hypothetical protein [Burkholderiales bacterium]
NSVTHESARLNIEEIRGGANSSSIGARDYTVVDAGAGDDFVYVNDDPGYALADTSRGYGRLGSLLYGNEGDDLLTGGAGNDILIGGSGDDSLSGDTGADTYARVGEGSDSITDIGDDLDRYRQSYFNVANFSDLEVREAGGGRFLDTVAYAQYGLLGEVRMLFESPQAGLERVLGDLEDALESERDLYATLLTWDGTGAPPTYDGQTAHDVRKRIEEYETEIAWEESRYLERFVYVEPLPPLPVIAGNDHAAIEPYYDSAVWIDRVELAEKWRADELIVSTSEVDGEPGLLHLDHPDGDRVTFTLARSADPIGTGIEVIGFADGTELTIQQVLARAIATSNFAGWDGYDELLGGPDAEVLAGRGGDDCLEGGGGHDTLLGGAGADTLRGGAGNDTYYVSAGDTATERSGQGVDTVYADVTWTLGRYFENLTLSGTDDIGATGNGFANVLTGNAGSNWLDGKGGGDTMAGGFGDDTYVVAQGADVAIENIDQGLDTVMASIGYTLGENLENLTLTGVRAINGTGNALANELTGNGAKNRLTGGAGDDRLSGLGGNDTLAGGPGDDTYLFGRGDGTDTIVENDSTPGNSDRARFLGGVAHDQIWFRRVGHDLEANIIGTDDALVLRDWYRGAARRVERIQTTDGDKTLPASNVQALVDAMAAFAPPAPGMTTLPLDYQTALNPTIAASWQ